MMLPLRRIAPTLSMLCIAAWPQVVAATEVSTEVSTETPVVPASPAISRDALPRWEWGVGLAAAWLRDYPGSSHTGTYALPYPWFVWRSERAEVGREGGRGILYRTTRFEIDFTLSANPPSSAGDNPERAGMPDLDTLLEPGLRARWRMPIDDAGRWHAELRLPVRQAIRVDGDLGTHRVGLHTEPGVSIDWRVAHGWTLGVSLAAGFAEKAYNDYYYGVPPAAATPVRPAYEADGGYTGWQTALRASWRSGPLVASAFARVENVADSSYADSPLVTSGHGYTVGGALSWRIGRSKRHVGDRIPVSRE